MPRAGWLALGAIGAALLSSPVSVVGLLLPAMAGVLAVALLGIATGRAGVATLGVGAVLVLCRAAAGGLAAPVEGPDNHAVSTGTAEHRAVVLSLGAASGGEQRVVVQLRPPEAPEHVYARLPRYPALVPGDEISFRGALEPAPDEPGFGEFLARSGIRFTSRARAMDYIGRGDSPTAGLESVRRAAGEALARALPEPHAGLAAAILIGLRDLVSRDVADAFRTSGLSHVVAISGWHIALLGAVAGAALRGLDRRPRSLLVLAAIASYSVLAGASPSVIRAALMAGVVLIARESGRKGQASAALGLAAVGMLLVEPKTVEDLGFQLSLTATAGLLRWATPFGSALRQRLPQRTPGWLVEALAVSLAAQAATLPLVLLHFGRLSLVAPLANLLVAPLVAPVMLAAALALAAGMLLAIGVPAIVLAPFTVFGALAVGTMITIANVSASMPLASVELPPPFDLASAGLAGIFLLLLLRRRAQSTIPPGPPAPRAARSEDRKPGRRQLRPALGATAAALVLLFVLVAAARPDGRLHMTVLDVGQGDAILVEGPSGGRMLVDTGPDPDRLVGLLDARIPAWDRRLDLVVITHPHEDHVAGLALLLDRYRIGTVAEPGMVGLGPGDAAFRRRLVELGRQTRVVAAGDRLNLDGVQIDVHWPLPGRVPLRPSDSGKQINNVSIVLELRFGERRFLLTGDVEEEIDRPLLAGGLGGPQKGTVDVLKVAHHGSGTATTDAFVDRLRPAVAIVSAGWGNPYGHPSPGTVARLESAGARVFRTDLDGSVEITTDGRDLMALATGGRPRRSADLPSAPSGPGFCPIPTQVGTRRRPYNRGDGRSLPNRSRARPARVRPARLVRRPLRSRCRDRGLSRASHYRARDRAGPRGCGGGSAAA
ncbi:MAG TPA: ComEC/Rec2 family competence protein [Candidatus Caenarcaniphilales bacterium]|nr:ComEC/Rec2 family competence protein [Candidatus Caenarcaniphilales bacterium]